MKRLLQGITPNVLILGLVSFFTDISAEMIYPLLPLFVVQYLGAGTAFLGVMEGFAESIAAFLKLGSGIWADRAKDRTRLVLFGYTLSSLTRPFMAAAQVPWHVFAVRTADRTGKGIRTSPRDALLADSVDTGARGKAFGFQRSMDHAGAVLGPAVASLLLWAGIQNLRHIFWLAAIPGVIAVILIVWRLREVKYVVGRSAPPARPQLPRGKTAVYLGILFLFLLSNSSDMFLLLRASQLGVPTPLVPILWMCFSGVKALTVMPLGALSDRIGRRRMILCGWLLYAAVYCGFSFALPQAAVWVLFLLYGCFYGLTEAVERAFLADLAEPGQRGQAFGWFNFVEGIALLPASALFGLVWQKAGASAAFLMGSTIAFAASALFYLFNRRAGRHV